jgi:hypothetical protein
MATSEEMQAAEKHALVQTCNTPGWRVVLKIAHEISSEAQSRAMTCADETQSVVLLRKAQAFKEYHDTLINRLDRQKMLDAGPDPVFNPPVEDPDTDLQDED